jgi:hypothetical protein
MFCAHPVVFCEEVFCGTETLSYVLFVCYERTRVQYLSGSGVAAPESARVVSNTATITTVQCRTHGQGSPGAPSLSPQRARVSNNNYPRVLFLLLVVTSTPHHLREMRHRRLAGIPCLPRTRSKWSSLQRTRASGEDQFYPGEAVKHAVGPTDGARGPEIHKSCHPPLRFSSCPLRRIFPPQAIGRASIV